MAHRLPRDDGIFRGLEIRDLIRSSDIGEALEPIKLQAGFESNSNNDLFPTAND
jgi:hypothetical protein